jgi:hypothetical protein
VGAQTHFFDNNGWGYEIIAYTDGTGILNPSNGGGAPPAEGVNGIVYFCKLRTPFNADAEQWADYGWPGLVSGATMRAGNTVGPPVAGTGVDLTGLYTPPGAANANVKLTLESFELLFGSGPNKFSSCSNLLGFNKVDYGTSLSNLNKKPILTDKQILYNMHGGIAVANQSFGKILIPRGLSFRAENDWYLHGDNEYLLLSINGDGDILSDTDCNINGKFACVIYDNQTSAVLQGLSSGPSITQHYSGKQTNNTTMPAFINQVNSSSTLINGGVSGTNILTGSVGTTNSFTSSLGGAPRGVAGDCLSGRQIITFENPIRNLQRFRIKFSKFNKQEELYDFKGKDHLLIFEIKMKKCNISEPPPSDMERLISAVNNSGMRR